MQIILTVIAIILGALFYRFGGMDKPFKSWMRDWICPLFTYGILLIWWHPVTLLGWLMLIPAYGILGASYSTYWDWLFGYDNFWFHGFMCGLASFPLIFAGLHWCSVIISAIVSGIICGAISKIFGNVWIEECGRGGTITATRLLLFI